MSDKSNYLENYYLLHFFNNFDPIYIALFSTNPGEDGSGTEFNAASYDRATVFAGTFAVTDSAATNSSAVQFSESQEIWGTASHAAIYDSLVGGNLLYYGALDSPVEINVNQVFRFQASGFTITEA